MHTADPLLDMKNGEFGSENKMLKSIIIDPNYCCCRNSIRVLPLLLRAKELLSITISNNCDVEKYFVIQDHICDLGQNDIIVTVL